MLNLQAALGVSQIGELEKFIEIKKRNYDLYAELLRDIPGLRLLPFGDGIRSNRWFYSLLIDDERDSLMHKLIATGVQCRPLWKLIHTQKPYLAARAYDIEKAYFYEKRILNIPCSTSLPEEDVRYVCERIRASV
jgi:dTDP-4-amino-4,6-dideoxygalactose transaminase